jgi:hypothetical protein
MVTTNSIKPGQCAQCYSGRPDGKELKITVKGYNYIALYIILTLILESFAIVSRNYNI